MDCVEIFKFKLTLNFLSLIIFSKCKYRKKFKKKTLNISNFIFIIYYVIYFTI